MPSYVIYATELPWAIPQGLWDDQIRLKLVKIRLKLVKILILIMVNKSQQSRVLALCQALCVKF